MSTVLALNRSASAMLSDATDVWNGYVEKAQPYIAPYMPSSTRMTIIGLVNLPIIILLLNALWQSVSLS